MPQKPNCPKDYNITFQSVSMASSLCLVSYPITSVDSSLTYLVMVSAMRIYNSRPTICKVASAKALSCTPLHIHLQWNYISHKQIDFVD